MQEQVADADLSFRTIRPVRPALAFRSVGLTSDYITQRHSGAQLDPDPGRVDSASSGLLAYGQLGSQPA
ncbi:hypothetical protein ACFPRL_11165 [Pseudoclavibacter helvolus]